MDVCVDCGGMAMMPIKLRLPSKNWPKVPSQLAIFRSNIANNQPANLKQRNKPNQW